ncbi:MAG: iron-containing alcohol dehydrogenase [Anaerolineae bacterium]|uniref:iron-containing alcohol dehydrogenase n=1 Tax=Candidatus Flexifilum breve TaxID=3140694 RepID=UPI001AD2A3E1|nr:iron-containing alcohol dehydrogenase [Chloroflexota bacterium]MBN8634951.1 iron-containing alcohol dehydrogenase [Anaerolineae bacterium]
MTTIYSLPNVEITHLVDIVEERPIALLAGERAWRAVNSLLSLPIVVQANPERLEADYLDGLAADLPPEVEAVYGIGGGMVADAAKYIASRRGLPAVVMPTALSVDGFFTPIVAMRGGGSVSYVETGPAERIYIDWDVIRTAPQHYRGAAIVELLTIVTGLLDWKYAAEHNKNTADMRYVEWAAKVMAGIAQQAFKIAAGVGRGNVEALRNLLDLMCLEVQITNQLGHTRPQEGSEQYFAYALEPRMVTRHMTYADMVAPGILISAALHNQDVSSIRSTLESAGIRLNQLTAQDIRDTINILPNYVRKHNLPYSILNDLDLTSERVDEILAQTGLDKSS